MAELRLPTAQFEIGFGKSVPRTNEALSADVRRNIARDVADHLSASDRDGTLWCIEVRDVKVVIEPGTAIRKNVSLDALRTEGANL